MHLASWEGKFTHLGQDLRKSPSKEGGPEGWAQAISLGKVLGREGRNMSLGVRRMLGKNTARADSASGVAGLCLWSKSGAPIY